VEDTTVEFRSEWKEAIRQREEGVMIAVPFNPVPGPTLPPWALQMADRWGWSTSYRLARTGPQPRFSGQARTAAVAGSQEKHPWCGVHSLGNLVQFSFPGCGEEVNAFIVTVAGAAGGMRQEAGGPTLSQLHFEPLLEQVFHVPATWAVYDRGRMIQHLNANQGVLAVVNAAGLNPARYLPAWHAVNLTDLRRDGAGIVWYKGLDSNEPGMECWWPLEYVETALGDAHQEFGVNVLVTDGPVRWPYRTAAFHP
jgi:hypothetical protein